MEVFHVRRHLPRFGLRLHRIAVRLRARSQPHLMEGFMFEPLLGLAVAVALGVYLLITLLKPERF
ncbi:ATPase (modular protein) [Methylocella tundrae]|uniref:ATPase (Modular protein) n=1 Tax=Methylocella tundrae TaxID=227605 RepID=A0A8B6LZ35_METTU|nr:ATPase (modular protein) [Methylocella tundrae]